VAQTPPEAVPPNIVILFADDLGYDDLGCYWTPNEEPGYERIDTPHIDRMASEGVRLTSFYAGGPVCTPSRAALMTGCYPVRVGLSFPENRRQVLDYRSRVGLHPDEITIAELLKTRGYATACIGKWHLGHRPPFLPTAQGFDLFVGVTFRSEPGSRIRRNGVVIDTLGAAELTARFTDEAIDFVSSNKDRPFFLYLAYTAPHVPLAVRPESAGRSPRGLYGDVVADLDDHVGRFMAALDSMGLDDQTLVIFASDNGPDLSLEDHGGKAFPLKGGKSGAAEGAVRVPCIVRWPNRIPQQQTCKTLVTAMDILPTVARLAGAALPTDRVIDGEDVWHILSTPDKERRQSARSYYYYRRDNLVAVRHGRWKLNFVRDPDPGKARAIPGSLFDLAKDPGETTNMTQRNIRVFQLLIAMADKMRNDLGDAYSGNPPKNARPVGYYPVPGEGSSTK
jgi:arylsulfatase A-like enzyme